MFVLSRPVSESTFSHEKYSDLWRMKTQVINSMLTLILSHILKFTIVDPLNIFLSHILTIFDPFSYFGPGTGHFTLKFIFKF